MPRSQFYDVALDSSSGEAVTSATMTVYNFGTTDLADIYSTESAALPTDNPITPDTAGYFEFWAEPGSYDLVIADGSSVPAFAPRTIRFDSIPAVDGVVEATILDEVVTVEKLDPDLVLPTKAVNRFYGYCEIGEFVSVTAVDPKWYHIQTFNYSAIEDLSGLNNASLYNSGNKRVYLPETGVYNINIDVMVNRTMYIFPSNSYLEIYENESLLKRYRHRGRGGNEPRDYYDINITLVADSANYSFLHYAEVPGENLEIDTGSGSVTPDDGSTFTFDWLNTLTIERVADIA